MNTSQVKPESLPGSDSNWIHRLGSVVFIAVIIAVVLYPENYMPDAILIGGQRILPLTLMLPIVVFSLLATLASLREELRFNLVDIALCIFVLYFFLNNFAGEYSGATVKYSVYMVSMFYLAFTVISSESSRRYLGLVISSLVVLTSVFGIAEFITGKNLILSGFLADTVPEPSRTFHRSGSMLAHPVTFGSFLVQALPFCILLWISGRTSRERMLGSAAAILGLLALFFTFSMGSWTTFIALVGVTTGYFIFQKRRTMFIPLLVLVAISLLAAGIFQEELAIQIEEKRASSIMPRLGGWEVAWDTFKDDPWTGVGLRQGRIAMYEQFEGFQRFYEVNDRYKPVDNNYMNILLEQGLLGLTFWLLFIIILIIGGIQALRRKGSQKAWLVASFASVMAFLINSITFDASLVWSSVVIFFAAAGLLNGSCKLGDSIMMDSKTATG